MSLYALAKKELLEIIYDRKYVLGFTLQFLLLLAIVPAFSSYLSEEGFRLPAPTMKRFVPVGVVDHSEKSDIFLQALRESERLELYFFDSFPRRELEEGGIAAVIEIPPAYDERALLLLPISVTVASDNIKGDSARDAIDKAIAEASLRLEERRKAILQVDTKDIFIERRFLRPVVVEREGSRYSSFFLGYLIPIVLFFPIFTSSSLIVDAVVGEKERKTIEMLLAAPVQRSTILNGKFVAIYGLITLQVLAWLAALRLEGIAIANLSSVFLLLAAVNLALTATAFVLAAFSRTVKEASIALMLLYVAAFVFLITSLTMEFFNPQRFLEFSPFNSISRLALGEQVGASSYALSLLALGAYSALAMWLASELMGRDDIIFGPRPDLMSLLGDGAEGILARLQGRPMLGGAAVAFLSGVISIPLALALEVSAGVLLLYAMGYGEPSLAAMIIVFALIEEALKPIALYALQARRRWLTDAKTAALYGSLAGLSFFILENVFVVLLLLFSFPSMIFRILSLRTGSTLLLHLLTSGLVGIGISREREFYYFLALATAVHAAYNLALLTAVL